MVLLTTAPHTQTTVGITAAAQAPTEAERLPGQESLLMPAVGSAPWSGWLSQLHNLYPRCVRAQQQYFPQRLQGCAQSTLADSEQHRARHDQGNYAQRSIDRGNSTLRLTRCTTKNDICCLYCQRRGTDSINRN